jgi:CheY-like chemotaxis protein
MIESRRHTLLVTPPPPGLMVEGDFDRLVQVLGNLLNNSAKYTDPGGQIWLEARREDGDAVIRVRDNGIGIAPEVLPHVFELFTQAERSLDRSQGGLGIGLTLVQTLVQMHGGRVEAASDGLGKGSTFTVWLPLTELACGPGVPAGGPARQAAQAPSGAPARPRIMVVDDIEDTAASMAEVLDLWGYPVKIACDGFKALELARVFQPDVVLLDIGLPGMDGYEVARRLRQEHADRPMLLAAMTGYGQEQDREATRAAGFDHHLVKPVDLAMLRQLLAHASAVAQEAQGNAECGMRNAE